MNSDPRDVRIAKLEARLARLSEAVLEWLEHLESQGRYLDGVPGELMDVLEALSSGRELD